MEKSLFKKKAVIILIGILSFCFEAYADPQETARELSQAFVKSAQMITPAVVSISVTLKDREKYGVGPSQAMTPLVPPEFRSSGVGTGVIVDFSGHIITNFM